MLTTEQIEHIVQESFLHYRNIYGFPYENLTPLQLWYTFFLLLNRQSKIMKSNKGFFKKNVVEIDGTGTKITDHFHSHIFESHALHMCSAIDAFYDDIRLKKAIRLVLEQNMPITDKSVQRMLRLVNGTQICANFRPMGAKTIYNEYVIDGEGDILDPSTGYGGRLLGYLANNFKKTKYVGIDPNTKTHTANKQIADFFGKSRFVKLHNLPFEDFSPEKKKYQLAFTSPPYFKKEIYSIEQTQSCHRYVDYKEWLSNFWSQAIQNTHTALTDKGYFIINIQDIHIRTKKFPLVADTKKLMRKHGFKLTETIDMIFPGFGRSLGKRKTEPIFVFQKQDKRRNNANNKKNSTNQRIGKRKRRTRQ